MKPKTKLLGLLLPTLIGVVLGTTFLTPLFPLYGGQSRAGGVGGFVGLTVGILWRITKKRFV